MESVAECSSDWGKALFNFFPRVNHGRIRSPCQELSDTFLFKLLFLKQVISCIVPILERHVRDMKYFSWMERQSRI